MTETSDRPHQPVTIATRNGGTIQVEYAEPDKCKDHPSNYGSPCNNSPIKVTTQ